MRYLRLYKGSEGGAPGVTLYEVDEAGWVHRQLQIHADGVRFSPEHILLRRPLCVASMLAHPDAEAIDLDEFERHWAELDHGRPFRARVPDPWRAWRGRLAGAAACELQWNPSGASPGEGWRRVPGFVRLYVRGDAELAWRVQRALFLEAAIEWDAAACRDYGSDGPIREVVSAPALVAALQERRPVRPLAITA